MLKSRKPGEPYPFVAPETFTQWVKYTLDRAAKNMENEKQKAGGR